MRENEMGRRAQLRVRWGRRARARGERGSASVELGLMVPMLALLLFGAISWGYLLSFRQAVSQGASEGARAAALWASTYSSSQDASRGSEARQRVDAALRSYGIGCSDGATCNVSFGPCDTATCVTVTVSYNYGADPLTPGGELVPMPDVVSYTSSVRVK